MNRDEVLAVEEYKTDLDNCYSEQREQTSAKRVCVADRRVDLDRRRGPGRRRTDDRRAAEEGQMTDEQFSFVMAIDQYKKQNNRPFPTWTEVLEIVQALGYRKVAEPCSIGDLKKESTEQ
ncbi:MAG: hypothetical protein ABFD79_03050 [Phycisphaerales bacterium]